MSWKTVAFGAGAFAVVLACGWFLLPEPPPPKPRLTEAQKLERDRFLSEVKREMPLLDSVSSVPTTSAAGVFGHVNPDELVIGLVVNNEARAYPLNIINTPHRKVMNDVLGGEPVLVTWCDLCHSAAAFSRKVGEQVDEFACSGMLWHGMLVMYDVRTESFWNPLIGKALAGTRSGESLQPIDVALTSWDRWRTSHPQTTVAFGEHVQRSFTTGYYKARMEIGDWAFGINSNGESNAWTLDYLRAHPIVEASVAGRPAVVFYDAQSVTARMYSASVDGQTLHFSASGDSIVDQQTSSQWDVLTGQATSGPLAGKTLTPIPAVWAFENFWRDLFPGANIEGASAVPSPAGG